MKIVGADDLDRAVTRAGDIAVGSSGLRLAPPKPAGSDAALSGDDPTTGVTGGRATATVTTDARGTAPVGSASGGTGAPQQPELKEREIAFSLMTSMSDSATRDAVRRLLLDLSNAADDGDISWAQIQVKVVATEEAAAKIVQDIRATGTNPSSRSV
jgi:hypothetical protein